MPKRSSTALKTTLQPPFSYFGGKRLIAPIVWRLLGAPQTYIEPFAGSLAVLLARPLPITGSIVEIVNDADGLIVNLWRGIRTDPDSITRWLDRPAAEADLVAAHNYLYENRERIRELVLSDPTACDPMAAAYYVFFLRYNVGAPTMSRALRFSKPSKPVNRNYQMLVVDETGLERTIFDKSSAALLYRIAARLRYANILCGDWTRCFTGHWWRGKESSGDQRTVGIYMDPPYGDTNRADVYTVESYSVAYGAMEWCLQHAMEPGIRIVFSCYDEFLKPPWCERLSDQGWRIINWRTSGGYSNARKKSANLNRFREIFYISPQCKSHPDAVPLASVL